MSKMTRSGTPIIVVSVLLVLSQQAVMKPTDLNKDSMKANHLEEELEAEAKHKTLSKPKSDIKDSYQSSDGVNGIEVGNVIRDVLLTLRDHPEIVRKLIADEEKNLAEQILSSVNDRKLDGETEYLVLPVKVPPQELQLPSPQLQQAPKTVVKKMGSYNKYEIKRQKETPEETIDMTLPEDGGSDEDDGSNELKDLNGANLAGGSSKEMKHLNVAHLVEGGSNKPAYAGLKRSEESHDYNSDATSESNEQKWKIYKDRKNKAKAEYWKNYRKNKDNSKLDSDQDNKEAYWKTYLQNKDKTNQDSDQSDDSKEGFTKAQYWKNHGRKNNDSDESKESKGKFWRNYGKNKDKSKVPSDDKSDEVDSPELDHSKQVKSSEHTESDENELDLNELTNKDEQRAVM